MNLLVTLGIVSAAMGTSPADSNLIYKSKSYEVRADRVVQGSFYSAAKSAAELESSYVSPTDVKHRAVEFKFSINSRDNELPSGTNHLLTLLPKNGMVTTSVVFGTQSVDTVAGRSNERLENGIRWKIKLDFNPVLKSFKEKGYYELASGEKIYRADFKGVYVAGNMEPLSWDFENLYHMDGLELKDPDGDGVYETELILNPAKAASGIRTWKLSADISKFPHYSSSQVMVDALYNLGLEESVKAVEKDSTFRTGALWGGVWTRDISYSIYLAQAILNPVVAKYSLLRKVQNGRIIQDTGTGGSWPVSTDRVVWAMAAWEVYCVTGDKEWLNTIYPIIKNSLEDDWLIARNPQTGLMYGESSFLDWREQEYAKWMRPVDIYTSQTLGTNALHYKAYRVLADISKELGKDYASYEQRANDIKAAINEHLWMKDKGYYAQFLYGKNYLLQSPRSETLGEALCILFGIASPEQSAYIVSHMPTTEFGTTCFYPQIPNISPYHNNAIWPFVQSYWSLAAAKAKNEGMVEHSMASVYRPAALFLSNWENMVAETGDYKGTAINSNVMLWSISGNLAHIYRLFYGMSFNPKGVEFHPFVPNSVSGDKRLSNFKYRKATLDITLKGAGSQIASFKVDGVEQAAFISADLEGVHKVEITLLQDSSKNLVSVNPVIFSLPEPSIRIENGELVIDKVKGAARYNIYRNGKLVASQVETLFKIDNSVSYQEYTVAAVDANGVQSFAAKPVGYYPSSATYTVEATRYSSSSQASKGDVAKGFIVLDKQVNTKVEYIVEVKESGYYFVDFLYSNGSGPINTSNKCAIRTLGVNGHRVGAIIMPQMGQDEWSSSSYSNSLLVKLAKGRNTLTVSFEEPANENMNVEVNRALLKAIRLVRAKKP